MEPIINSAGGLPDIKLATQGAAPASAPASAPVPAPAPTPASAAVPSAAAVELEQSYKRFLSAKNSTDINSLTTQIVKTILEAAVKEGASDIHFDPREDNYRLRFRIDGELKDRLVLAKTDFPVTSQIRVMAGFSPQSATAYTPEDGGFQLPSETYNARFRVSAFPSIHGDKLVLRILDSSQNALSLNNLGFTTDILAQVKSAIQLPNGIFFVCGITGGGKTTTLCTILQALIRPEVNIMTLEDPVEYELPGVIQSKIHPKGGFTFADGLRSLLRQDPNVIMLGEVRDVETAEIAMRAAMTGHLIFSTIHSISAVGVISRLIDMGIEPFLIANSMIGVLAQRLIRKVCVKCAQPVAVDPAVVDALLKSLDPDDANLIRLALAQPGGKFVRGKGCAACDMSGFKGRVGIFELLNMTKEVRDLTATKATSGALRRCAVELGMKTLLMDGAQKAWMGLTTLEEVAKAAKEM